MNTTYRKSVNSQVSKRSHGSADRRGLLVVEDLKSQIGLSTFLQYFVQSQVDLFGIMNTFCGLCAVLVPHALGIVGALGFSGRTVALHGLLVKVTGLVAYFLGNALGHHAFKTRFYGESACSGHRGVDIWN